MLVVNILGLLLFQMDGATQTAIMLIPSSAPRTPIRVISPSSILYQNSCVHLEDPKIPFPSDNSHDSFILNCDDLFSLL